MIVETWKVVFWILYVLFFLILFAIGFRVAKTEIQLGLVLLSTFFTLWILMGVFFGFLMLAVMSLMQEKDDISTAAFFILVTLSLMGQIGVIIWIKTSKKYKEQKTIKGA